MSDLDDFFAKRLDEEASFPNRGKNWQQMSQRLDAFDSGTVQDNRPGLRGWQIATFLAVAAAGFLLWKTFIVRQESKALRHEVIALQSERSMLLQQLGDTKKVGSDVTLKEIPPPIPRVSEGIQNQSVKPIDLSEKSIARQSFKSSNTPLKSVLTEAVVASKSTETTIGNATQKETAPADFEPISFSEKQATPENEWVRSDSAITQSSEISTLVLNLDSLANRGTKVDSLAAEIEASKVIIASNASNTPPIKPVTVIKNRLRVGAQASVGLVQPHQKGVSSLLGQGITMEVNAFHSFWVVGSIDWLHHEVSTESFVPKFHPPHDSFPKPPDGGIGGHQDPPKLVLVESSERRQQFALGIRYELPVKGWFQPSVRVVHEWVHVLPALITYKFEENDPMPGPGPHNRPPLYTLEKFKDQWLSNQWRFGLGLEKDIPNWTFSLWADYSKDFSAATPSFDALYFRAGTQFRF
jgi:hypothetical protein